MQSIERHTKLINAPGKAKRPKLIACGMLMSSSRHCQNKKAKLYPFRKWRDAKLLCRLSRLECRGRVDLKALLRMDECTDSLGDAALLTTLDCSSRYGQIKIASADRKKTIFAYHFGVFRFIRMPFGMKSIPLTSQKAVDIILSRVKWKTALMFLNDGIMYFKTVPRHLRHVREIPQLLKTAVMTLKSTKYTFFDTAVFSVGHAIRPG